MTDPPGDGNVTAWRLQELEKKVDEAVRAMQQGTVAVGAQITALSNQIGNAMAGLPEHYSPRREAEERHAAIEERFEALDHRLNERKRAVDERIGAIERNVNDRISTLEKTQDDNIKTNRMRIERIEQAGWAFAVGLVGTLLAALFAVFKSLNGGG